MAGRAIAGQAPPMKEAAPADQVTGLILDGLRDGRRELRYDLQKAELTLR